MSSYPLKCTHAAGNCMQDVVALSYANLLAEAATVLGPSAAYHSLWPSSTPLAQWARIIPRVYEALHGLAVVYTLADGGRWLQPAAAVYADDSSHR